MRYVQFIRTYGKMTELMEEPAWVLTDEAVDRTESVTATFLWDPSDNDSNVVLTRTSTYDASDREVAHTRWSVANAPTVSGITTDQAVNTVIAPLSPTVLTITGTNFGAADGDLEVFIYLQAEDGPNGPAPSSRGTEIVAAATITNVNVGDTEITARLEGLPFSHGGKIAKRGVPCKIEVRNKKRLLKSAQFTGLTAGQA